MVDEPLAIPLDEIQVDDKLNFIEEPVEIMDREVKRLKQSHISIVKVRWNSKRGPEFTWEHEDQMQKKRYFQHDLISYLKLKRFSSYVGIALLTITGSLDTALDLNYFLGCLMDDLWASELSISDLSPADRDGKPLICCKCESPLRGRFCWFCASNSEISFNPNPNSFNDPQNLSDYSPQPQYETYPCELYGNDSHYGYDCPPRFLFIYEQKPCYNQNYYPHNSPSFLCSHESFQCQSMNQNFLEPNPCYEPNSSSFDQYQPSQSFVTQKLPQRSNEDIKLEMAKLIKNNQILLNNNIFPYEEASMEVLLAKERIHKLIQAWDDKQIESWSLPDLLLQLLNDSRTIDEMLKQREQAANRTVQQEQEEQVGQIFTPNWNFSMINDDEEHSIQYKEYLENSSNAITTVLPTEEPEYSLSLGYEHLSTISETKSDEVIESSAKNLLQIPSEYEVTSDDESECDVLVKDESSPVFTTFSNPLFDCNDDFTSSDDESLSNEDVPVENCKVYSNPLFDDEEISSDEIDPHCFNAESDLIESLSKHDTLFDSSPKFDYLEEISGELMPSSIINEERIRREHEEYISLIKKEEINIFTGTDDLLPPGIESEDYDSKEDIHFLEELLVNDSIPLTKNKSSNFDHHDDPLFPRLPPEPPDIVFFFDFEPNLGEVISAVMNNIDELNEDECFDLGGRSLCFVLEMHNKVTPPDTYSVQAPFEGMTYGKYNYEEGLIDHIYKQETQRFTIQASSSKALIFNNHFQDSDSYVEEDQRTNNKFMVDLNAEYHGRALLANQNRFYKRSGRVRSTRKPIDKSKETCFTYGN
nr:putative reverse transcriptase domain-containing protein [Tanacetum cinerariifolium]